MNKCKTLNLWFVPLVILTLVACQPAQVQGGRLTVFAASSLTNAFTEIAAAFKVGHPDTEIQLNFGASTQLATQISQGAPADLFASASVKSIQPVIDAKLIDGQPPIFATNQLIIITPADNPARVAALNDLARPGLRLVTAVAGVPIRDYTNQMLDKLAKDAAYGEAYRQAFNTNLVSEEDNVRAVVAKVALGEADGAIVYISDVTPDIAARIHQVAIPAGFNVSASYPIGKLAASKQPELAQAFIDFLLSPDGQAILKKWGFGPAEPR